MSKPKILIQLDGDAQTSVFDAVVAVDSGVDQLLQHQGVTPDAVRDLVHGAMFTRGPKHLHNTAIFIGGSDVAAGEALLEAVVACFFGPMRVSVMMDASGANTTAAAAVLAAARHVDLSGAKATVLAATGPVGRRVARLLAREGAEVRVGSRSGERAQQVCEAISAQVDGARLTACETATPKQTFAAVDGAEVIVAAGAAGVELLSEQDRQRCESLKVAIDLNAVPPAGLGGVEVTEAAVEKDGAICYGAIGVGGDKMKIHKAAIRRLFESHDQVLDAEQIFQIGREMRI
ncbi:MAG: bifunctional NADP-dependent methylenetetrahydromethanopterin dehydrogenase/methylenetetrahydrofolate dehydrogenase [Planctomycetes bacterium]|nr:bifunctional NADP-dependent methylenetetrahydromethanopterin dehydrogenase/methylenetetrahydrofolate dehydrogenase [Planctomycetota bacterium]